MNTMESSVYIKKTPCSKLQFNIHVPLRATTALGYGKVVANNLYLTDD